LEVIFHIIIDFNGHTTSIHETLDQTTSLFFLRVYGKKGPFDLIIGVFKHNFNVTPFLFFQCNSWTVSSRIATPHLEYFILA
jgi:hypothetical protein